ncbi:hypothetical protein BVRB_7g169070 [Beta vulgaris subsp. vulgaris]|uniref:peamaclein-like n=1 Tax=Beta vulgaris subsp. vulgaris TaxID=3555 RepID=UPI00065C5098|nr:peamaclein-like [Beta vulgaris subsp. vulgaris]KMT04726.1 hypothetical protein BVRB_7g169070 [Beta vulgaris subsp. vulgaris]
MKKLSIPTLLLISIVLTSAVLEIADATSSPGGPDFCPSKCASRCSKNPRNLCKKLCMICCSKCKCVPSGPLADKSECPCYRDWKNKKGMDKCP